MLCCAVLYITLLYFTLLCFALLLLSSHIRDFLEDCVETYYDKKNRIESYYDNELSLKSVR